MQLETQALVDEWARAFNSGRVADLAHFYAADARIVPPGRSALVGAEAICAYFTEIRARGFRDFAVDLGDVLAKDGSLVACGRWVLRGSDDSGIPRLYRGNWLNMLSSERAGWLIAVHMWN